MPKTTEGIAQARYMYSQPKNSIDVAFLGSSHTFCHVNTALLWEDYGVSAYDYSAAEQPLWTTYYYLREICKRQNPKLVVLDVFVPAVYSEDYHYDFMHDNMFGFRFSLNKLQMMKDSIELKELDKYFPGFFDYHNRYGEIAELDFKEITKSKEEKAAFKGYVPFFNVDKQTHPNFSEVGIGELSEKSEKYLNKIIEYCKKNQIELMLVVTPYPQPNDNQEMIYNKVEEIANENDIVFNNGNHHYEEIGIDFERDFNDFSHLNYWGSCKYTDYLAKKIKSDFTIEDHRGDSYYSSWDKHVKEINDMVSQQ